MKKHLITLALLAPIVVSASSFTGGDLVLLRVGDGTAPLVNSAGPISILEVNPTGSLVQPAISLPSGSGGLQVSGSATSEGQLVRNADGSSWTVAGYVAPFTGSGSLSGRTATQAPRGFVTVNSGGTVSAVTTLPGSSTYSGQNIRSGFNSGSRFWFTGSGTSSGNGLVTYDGSTASTVQGVNSRVLNLNNGDLYYSTGSGVTGLYKYSGIPTSPTTSAAFLTGVAGEGTSPYDFVFSPDGNSLYVADDGIGVQKFTFNGSSWGLAYNLTSAATGNKAFGLAVDFSGANPVVFWTTPTDLYSATDSGAAATGNSIMQAGANYAFRGLDMASPIPEPATVALVGVGLLAFAIRRRRG